MSPLQRGLPSHLSLNVSSVFSPRGTKFLFLYVCVLPGSCLTFPHWHRSSSRARLCGHQVHSARHSAWHKGNNGGRKPCALWLQPGWVQVPALPLTRCVTSGKSPKLCLSLCLCFLIYKIGMVVMGAFSEFLRVSTNLTCHECHVSYCYCSSYSLNKSAAH